MPSFLVPMTFLGQPCGSGMTEGVNPEMQVRLEAAEVAIRAAYDALQPKQRLDPWSGRAKASFLHWSGIEARHICWRANAAHHSTGAAIDINVLGNPYIVTRNAGVAGGHPGAHDLVDMRARALAGYDRAVQFSLGSQAVADVGARQPNESTESVWRRFREISEALVAYLSLAVDQRPARITRPAIENADAISDVDLLAAIPETERLPLSRALAELEKILSSPGFRAIHPHWVANPREQYLRILRDYEHVRIPMVIGDPSAAPTLTRNPARGFLNIRCEIATALCAQGLRWGACDFGVEADGSSQNGAMMHFDLADDGGYPEIPSLLRFG